MKSALENVKVVEIGESVSVPYCGKLMADLGADVLKVERPVLGDLARRRGPFLHNIPGADRSALFLDLNMNKRGVTLDIGTNTGREILQRLLQDADILVEDFTPGKLESMKLGYSHLKEINPHLVVTSLTPFGQTGPYRHFKGSDLVSAAMGGIAYANPRWTGDAGQEPMRALQIYSFISGITAALAAACALRVQRQTGLGQHVDVSRMETSALTLNFFGEYWPYNRTYVSRADKAEQAPAHDVRCKDGWVCIVTASEEQWKRFVDFMEKPELAEDERFRDVYARGEHWDALEPLITEWTSRYTKLELFEKAGKLRIPLAPVHTIAELVEREQFKERGFFIRVSHPATGEQTYPGAPYKLAETPWAVRMPAPLLGQHNKEIYCQRLSYSQQELVRMREAGII